MRLDGIHHIGAITGGAAACERFYAGVLGLRAVGEPPDGGPRGGELRFAGGSSSDPLLCFSALPDAPRGRPGAGMVRAIVWRVRDAEALDFWAVRLAAAGVPVRADGESAGLRFADPEGLEHELVVDSSADEPAPAAGGAEIAAEHALRGIDGVRALCRTPTASADLLAGRLGFATLGGDAYRVYGERRLSHYWIERSRNGRGVEGAGSVHHVAWGCAESDQPAWRQRVIGLGARVTPVLERSRSRSIYFREPSGVLFEIAAVGSSRAVADRRAGELAAPTTELPLPAAIAAA